MIKSDFKKEIISGPITKTLVRLAIPIVLANILQTFYQLIDTFWVGRLGAEAVAAVSLSFPVIFLLISLAGGLGTAGTVLVGQYKGKGDQSKVNYYGAQTFLLISIATFGLTIFGYVFSPAIVSLLGAEEIIWFDASWYLRISFLGMIFTFLYMISQSLLRGVGEVKLPLYIVLLSVALNFVLDPILMFGWGPIPELGVRGTAWATFITQGIAGLVGIYVLFSGRHGIKLFWKDFIWSNNTTKKILKLGLPSSIEQSFRSLSMLIMTFIVTSFGTLYLAAFGLGIRIFSFVVIPALGFAISASTMVSQNAGAGRADRVKHIARRGSQASFIILTTIGIILFFSISFITNFFLPGNELVTSISNEFIRIMAFSFGLIGIQMVLLGAFRGTGLPQVSMFFSISSLIITIGLAYFLSHFTLLGPKGIWWAYPLANVIGAVLAWLFYRYYDWHRKKIV